MDQTELSRIFQMFDRNGDGKITKQELNDSLENLGIYIPDKDLVQMIEKMDAVIPDILKLKPDVFIVTGDHSTPSKMKSHSWHPVPTLLMAEMCRPDEVTQFNERSCLHGGLGQFKAKYLMLQAMAHAGRLGKYGA